jgi:hypothetical protein
LIVDIDSGRIVREVKIPDRMKVPKTRPFGISRDASNGWYITNNDLLAHLDRDLNCLAVLPGLSENIHQIQYDPIGGRLWAVATSMDSLLSIDPGFSSIQRFCLLTDQWIPFDAPSSDTEHFNSISWRDDRLHVMAHRFSVQDSFVRTYDRQMKRLGEWLAGREAHCICEHEGEMLILDSRGGAILGDHGTHIQVCESLLYARGMAVTPDGRAVIAAFDFGARETRHTGDAYLRSYDLRTKRQMGEVRLAGTGNIQDIQVWR